MKQIFILIFTFISLSTYANFGGYYRYSSEGGGTILNSSNSQLIELIKERINIELDQRVNFNAEFFLNNTSSELQEITLAFPQFSHWEIPYESGQGYVPGDYYPLNETFSINGEKIKFDNELYSEMLKEYNKVHLVSRANFKNTLTNYAGMHEAESPPTMPFIIWKLKTIQFKPGETKKVSISFVRPWFYEDEMWSFGTSTNGERNFKYIFETANTWKNSKIKDFQMSIKFPEDSWENLNLNKPFFNRVSKNEVKVSLQDWTPTNEDNLNIVWKSNYKIKAKDDINCAESLYYDDYSWRFGFDGTKMTSWCLRPSNLICDNLYLEVNSKSEKQKICSSLYIISGFAKSEGLAVQNAKPKNMTLTYYDTAGKIHTQDIELANSTKAQKFVFKKAVDLSKEFKINILDFYPGTKYQDICLSELWLE
ncbi:NADase-type glycan-binding domain-containing protein [Marivirga sericea]|nr:hypothetical protein [Marivirga sericea]